MSLPMLMEQIEANYQIEDNSTRLINAVMLAAAEKRFNAGEAGTEYADFRHYCSHLLPNRQWRDIRKLLSIGRSNDPVASRHEELAANSKSAQKYYERKKREKIELEAKVAKLARLIATK